MKKLKVLVSAIVVFLGCLICAIPLYAKGPVNAGGESPIVPFNPRAMEHALLMIMPLVNPNLGSETIIRESGATITVSEIPLAECDWDTWECEGTYMQLKWSKAWEAATNDQAPYYTGEWTRQAWSHYKFWLNGSGQVTISREYDDGMVETEIVTEFIFFKVQWVGNGEGNSNFDAGGNFDITIQSYK